MTRCTLLSGNSLIRSLDLQKMRLVASRGRGVSVYVTFEIEDIPL